MWLEQEFVYVGDEGIVEPSGKTFRRGVDLSLKYQPVKWMLVNTDVNYTLARYVEEERNSSYIPLAPKFTLMTGVNIFHPSRFSAGINMRHISDRPANETYTLTADGYTIVDLILVYDFPSLSLGVEIQNLLNTE